jgi:hypothetical protein
MQNKPNSTTQYDIRNTQYENNMQNEPNLTTPSVIPTEPSERSDLLNHTRPQAETTTQYDIRNTQYEKKTNPIYQYAIRNMRLFMQNEPNYTNALNKFKSSAKGGSTK